MEINSTNVNLNPTNLPKAEQSTATKEAPEMKKDGNKKLALALGALAVAGAAAVGITYAVKTGKIDGLKKTAEQAGEVVKNSADDATAKINQKRDLISKYESYLERTNNLSLPQWEVQGRKDLAQKHIDRLSKECEEIAHSADFTICKDIAKKACQGNPQFDEKTFPKLYRLVTNHLAGVPASEWNTPKTQGMIKQLEKYTNQTFSSPEEVQKTISEVVNAVGDQIGGNILRGVL